jgi:hypothetical protein
MGLLTSSKLVSALYVVQGLGFSILQPCTSHTSTTKTLEYIHAICREIYWQQQFQGNVDNKCSHNLVIVTHKVSNHHLLHRTEKGQAAMTTHWLQQLPKVVGIDEDILSNQKFVQTILQNFNPEFHISRNSRDTWSWYWLALKRHSLWTLKTFLRHCPTLNKSYLPWRRFLSEA